MEVTELIFLNGLTFLIALMLYGLYANRPH